MALSWLSVVYAVQQQTLFVLSQPNPIGAVFTSVVIVAFTFKFLDVMLIVINIITVNAFFIDWEQVCYYVILVTHFIYEVCYVLRTMQT